MYILSVLLLVLFSLLPRPPDTAASLGYPPTPPPGVHPSYGGGAGADGEDDDREEDISFVHVGSVDPTGGAQERAGSAGRAAAGGGGGPGKGGGGGVVGGGKDLRRTFGVGLVAQAVAGRGGAPGSSDHDKGSVGDIQ